MKRHEYKWTDTGVKVRIASFVPSSGGVSEHHAIVCLDDVFSSPPEQFGRIAEAIIRLKEELKPATAVFVRYFVSDAANQKDVLPCAASFGTCALSIVEQPPADMSRVTAWVYFVEDCISRIAGDGTVVVERPSYRHLFNTQMHAPILDESLETRLIFGNYVKTLAANHCSLKNNCLRTWIFVQGIDVRYAGMVRERKTLFEREGLVPSTRYIASTGIEGRHVDPRSTVLVDAYAVEGLVPEQIHRIEAPSHLNPTHEYGVTFERATSVTYGDRQHLFVSGTASIDNRGEVVAPADFAGQMTRMFENVEALLAAASLSMNDVVQMIVYLRDSADFPAAQKHLESHYDYIPTVVVRAPVCRPQWLVEAECIAIKSRKTAFALF
jgi:enamine deaminase RidA (YjgF/YER057c/UK114 family)